MVSTLDQVDAGFWIGTTTISFLPADADVTTVAATVRQHLLLSKRKVPVPDDYEAHFKQIVEAAGLKSGKAYHKGALYLSIYMRETGLSISATRNTGKAFEGVKDASIALDVSVDDLTLGNALSTAWSSCV